MFSFHIPSPDFMEVGQAPDFDECFRLMCDRADIVYGKNDTGKYAGGQIIDCSLKEAFDGKFTKIIYYLRVEGKWCLVPKNLYEEYADKFINQMPKLDL